MSAPDREPGRDAAQMSLLMVIPDVIYRKVLTNALIICQLPHLQAHPKPDDC